MEEITMDNSYQHVLVFVITLVKRVSDDENIGSETHIANLGLDSLDWAEVQTRVKDEFGVELASGRVRKDCSEPLQIDFTKVSDVVNYIHDQLRVRANGSRVSVA
jgi:acyl carrier protein